MRSCFIAADGALETLTQSLVFPLRVQGSLALLLQPSPRVRPAQQTEILAMKTKSPHTTRER